MIVDEVKITIKAGDGGDGHISFRREKYVPRGGPDGGNGGIGGDIYFTGVSDLSALRRFRSVKHVGGKNGEHGKNKKRSGKRGEDIIVRVPIGTKIIDYKSLEQVEILEAGQKILIVRGGRGGRGNFELKSNKDKAPKKAEAGRKGEEKTLRLSLQYIADIGLIGLPNAGKSSLLNLLTKAGAKVGAYPFTTLEANLGAFANIIIADIPGLIEGAHTGKGLGDKFLKHIEKTKLLVHCIDAEQTDVARAYKIIRNELGRFSKKLTQKPEIIILTKTDLTDEESINKNKEKLHSGHNLILTCSIYDKKSIKIIKNHLITSV